MKKRSNSLNITGLILIIISTLIFLFLLIYVSIFPISELNKSIWLFVLLGLAIILFIVGYIFLKKYNKIKKEEVSKENLEINKKIEEIYNDKLNKK